MTCDIGEIKATNILKMGKYSFGGGRLRNKRITNKRSTFLFMAWKQDSLLIPLIKEKKQNNCHG